MKLGASLKETKDTYDNIIFNENNTDWYLWQIQINMIANISYWLVRIGEYDNMLRGAIYELVNYGPSVLFKHIKAIITKNNEEFVLEKQKRASQFSTS